MSNRTQLTSWAKRCRGIDIPVGVPCGGADSVFNPTLLRVSNAGSSVGPACDAN